MTQRELSEKSGVNLRTIQQYERRSKDINKAAGATLRALALTLSCRVEDLLEYDVVTIWPFDLPPRRLAGGNVIKMRLAKVDFAVAGGIL